jgi:hypothetical protein
MDSGLNIGRSIGVADMAIARMPARGVETTPTVLPQRQAVAAVADPSASSPASEEGGGGADEHATRETVVFNKVTRGAVRCFVDPESGAVIDQVPSKSIVRAQVYARVLQDSGSRNQAQAAVNFDVQI